MPFALQEKGGWESKEVVEAYVTYAKTCFELFGDRVKKWFTHNEPIVPVEGGYLYQFHYPAVVDMKRAVQVAYHESLASAKAIKVYHEMNLDGEIGIILNLTPSYPRDPNDPEDVKAAQLADAFFNRSFLDPAIKGTFHEELAIIKENTIDLLGINYYQPRRIQKKESAERLSDKPMPDDYFDNYIWPDRKMNPYRGWEIYEKGIYDCLINVRDNYGNIACYISENGMGVEDEQRFKNADGVIEDDYRIDFIKGHLQYVHQALQEGVNVKGYHMWTCMDNWSWMNAYKNRYGFVSVDLEDNKKRTIKKSGHWFKEVTTNNGF